MLSTSRHLKSFLILLIFSSFPTNYSTMKIKTAGKSHSETGKEATTTAGLIFASSKFPSTIPRVVRRSSENELDATSLRDMSNGVKLQSMSLRPEKVTKFASLFARLLASLSSSMGRGLGLVAPATEIRNPNGIIGDGSNRRKRQVEGFSVFFGPSTSLCEPVEPAACRDVPFDAMVPHDDMILAFKNGSIHMLTPNGSVMANESIDSDHIFPALPDQVTGAMRMQGFIYVFFGTTYMKFRPVRRPIFPTPVPIPVGFHGVPTPINGAFQLNSHTYVIISGAKFVFYQPDAEPPVNPKFSPNLLVNIFGGPENVSTAFNTPDGRRFLASTSLLYELNDKMQVIKIQPFKRRPDGTGWLDCSPVVPPGCTNQTEDVKHSTAMTIPVVFGKAENSTIQFSSGTSIVRNPTPLEPPPEISLGATFPEPVVFSAGKFDMRSVLMGRKKTNETGAALLQESEISSVPKSVNGSTFARAHAVSSLIVGQRSGEGTRRKVAKLLNLTPFQSPIGAPQEADDNSEDAIGAAPGPPNETSREDSAKPTVGTGNIFSKQLEQHGLVLKELINKLNNLTHAISALPRPPVQPTNLLITNSSTG